MSRLLLTVVAALSVLSAGGCAINRSSALADESLRCESIKTVHVTFRNGDDRGTQELIVEKFRAKGFVVSADPASNPKADAVVTYKDQWIWDLTWYMLELTVTVREPGTDFPLASANAYHTSLTRKSPKEMVDEVVDSILKQCR